MLNVLIKIIKEIKYFNIIKIEINY